MVKRKSSARKNSDISNSVVHKIRRSSADKDFVSKDKKSKNTLKQNSMNRFRVSNSSKKDVESDRRRNTKSNDFFVQDFSSSDFKHNRVKKSDTTHYKEKKNSDNKKNNKHFSSTSSDRKISVKNEYFDDGLSYIKFDQNRNISGPANEFKKSHKTTSRKRNTPRDYNMAKKIFKTMDNVTYLSDFKNINKDSESMKKIQNKARVINENLHKKVHDTTTRMRNNANPYVGKMQDSLVNKSNVFYNKVTKADPKSKLILIVLCLALFVWIGFFCYKQIVSYSSDLKISSRNSVNKNLSASGFDFGKIPECDISDLSVNIFLDKNQLPVASGGSFGITITNKSTKTCLARAGSNKFGVRVVSGDQKIWDSTSCPVTSKDNPLLLSAGQTWKGSIVWDGYTYGKNCERLGVSSAGTYRVIGVKNGDLQDNAQNFSVK